MRFFSIISATAVATALASCGSESAENVSANVEAQEVNVQNAMPAEPAEAIADAPAPAAESAMPVPGSNVQEKQVFRDREPRRPPQQPEPKEEPKEEPPVDPHAGHDMNNMSH